jgi:hypothetical protein
VRRVLIVSRYGLDKEGKATKTATSDPQTAGDQRGGTSTAPNESMIFDQLPIMDLIDWYLQPNQKRCRNAGMPGGCWHASTVTGCHFYHVQEPLGEILDDDERVSESFPVQLDENNLHIEKRGGLFTAAYTDVDEKKIYYAERGPSKKSSQGIFWYPSPKDAEESIRRVLATTRSLNPRAKRTERRKVDKPSNPPKRWIASQRCVGATTNVAASAPPSVSPYGPATSDGSPSLANSNCI